MITEWTLQGERKYQRTRRVQEAQADGTAEALGQEELVVLGRQRCHHEPKDMQECADEDERRRAILVKQEADGRPQEKEPKDLERRDPCNDAAFVVFERAEFVITLKNADACM